MAADRQEGHFITDSAAAARALSVEVPAAAGEDPAPPRHPRAIGWIGTAAIGMGGSNQSIFLIGALIAGQGSIPGQGSAAIPLLILGLLLSFAAAPGWVELVLMSPGRVGGIAAACTAAFRPYSPILSALTGVCYWWGWVPTCGLTAIFSATALTQWVFPGLPVPLVASLLVAAFTALNFCGIAWVTRVTIPIASVSAGLAFVSMLAPVLAGTVDWHQATNFHLTTPFEGWFGSLTSLMAGLYLIGFGAPAFEAATCHVAETVDQNRNVPRAVLANALMAAVYFAALPVIWLGVIGSDGLSQDLNQSLGPTFAPVFGAGAKAAAIWFMMFNMFHGTIQPLAGAARTLSQLAEDGLLPRILARRLARTDAPWAAILFTAIVSILFLLIGDPIWLVAAANFTYLIGIGLPSVAVWLLRRDQPELPRPWRAPRGTIGLGVAAAVIWGLSALLGFEQFGLPTVVIGLCFAYSGALFYALRRMEDRWIAGLGAFTSSLHVTLTGAMLLVLALDAGGYIMAVSSLPATDTALITFLEDIFVAVAMLTVTVGIVLPGMIAHSVGEISVSARRLAAGTMREFSLAMDALGRGDLDRARAKVDIAPVAVTSQNELGAMAASFNLLQSEIQFAAQGLDRAREGLKASRAELEGARDAAEAGNRSKAQFLAMISHELRTPLNGVVGLSSLLLDGDLDPQSRLYTKMLRSAGDHLLTLINDLLDATALEANRITIETVPFDLDSLVRSVMDLIAPRAHEKALEINAFIDPALPPVLLGDPRRLRQVLINLLGNAVKFTESGDVLLEVLSDPDGAALADGMPAIRFAVHDTGPGIEAADIDKLFVLFSQVDRTVARRHEGSGLGLVISRLLAERMDGRITVTSEPGRGSVFTMTLPLRGAPPAEAAQVKPRGLARLHGESVLLVHPHPASAGALARIITSRGGQVVVAGDAAAARASLAAAQAPFAAALIFETVAEGAVDAAGAANAEAVAALLAAAVRAAGAGTRVVLMRRGDQRPDIGEDAALYDAVLLCPMPNDTLIYRIRGGDRRALADAAPEGPRDSRGMDVLVAEDNPTNQAVIRAMLRKLGHRAEVVGNGAEALRALQAGQYDVVLMDVMMPEMDGIAATQAIRALPGERGQVPIIGLTAHAAPEDHALYRSMGMTQVVSKPVTLPVLQAALLVAPPEGVAEGE